MDDTLLIGEWVKDRVLGSGSFGIVVLWKHRKTEEKLAIKTCKWADELTSKHKERWTKEVEMLQNCSNPNIVGTKELPPEFIKGLEKANPSKLPILCMEYCSGGDLRQLLNKPDSCAGLKESQVRQILSDMRIALQFLHSNKITHRDLKPENIVMHVLDNNGLSSPSPTNTIFKIIDLGYAKEIDSNSVCASFVGTLQYLAPEIFYSKTYSNSVDFWSFGLLAFEIITGTRPFLAFMAPVQWMPHVKKKTHDNICVYETFHGEIEYSNEIFPENRISKPIKALLEKWLRVALEWDPKLRGRDSPSKVTFNIPEEDKTNGSNVIIYKLLEEYLSVKIIKIFSIATLTQIAFKIDDSTSVSSLKDWIYEETQIPTSDQILISNDSYVELNNDEQLLKYWNEQKNVMLFLFNKSFIVKDDIKPSVPISVQRILEKPKTMYNFKNSQNLYRNGFYFVLSQMEDYDSFVNGLYARSEAMKNNGKVLLLKHNTVDKSIGKLMAKEEIVAKMVAKGKEHLEMLRVNGTGMNLMGGFEKIFTDSDDIIDKINKLNNAWSQLSIRLQSAARRSNEVLSGDLNAFIIKYNYQTIFTNTVKVYVNFRRCEFQGDSRAKEKQCTDILKVCYDCLKMRSKILQEMQTQPFILKLMDLSVEFNKISDIIEAASENTEKLIVDLVSKAEELTECLWTTISLISSEGEHLADLPYSVVSFQKLNFKIGEPVSNHCITVDNKVDENEQLKSLIQDTLKLRKSSKILTDKLNLQRKMIDKTVLDFSFLNGND